MQTLADILTWLGFVVAGLAVTGGAIVAVLSWLLNHPVDDDRKRRSAPRC